VSNKSLGYEAEDKAARYLESRGFQILEQNWHTRWCEVDIIAKKDSRIYFVEVKSRSSQSQGSGLDYITPKKLRQMSFAADMWVHSTKWIGEYQLAALAVDANKTTFIEDV